MKLIAWSNAIFITLFRSKDEGLDAELQISEGDYDSLSGRVKHVNATLTENISYDDIHIIQHLQFFMSAMGVWECEDRLFIIQHHILKKVLLL